MNEESRATLTGFLWFFCAVALVFLFISATAQGKLTVGHISLAVVILALAIIGTPYLLRWPDSETQQEKTKRQRFDNMLRNLTNEELIELKQRLSDADLREEPITSFLGDDGERIQRR